MSDSNGQSSLRKRFSSFLLVDLIFDKEARPVFLYVLVTIVSGSIIYHWLEDWSWLDSLYFVVITTTTIGYGDLAPTTAASKLVTIYFALNGVAILIMLFDQIRRLRSAKLLSIAEARKSSND